MTDVGSQMTREGGRAGINKNVTDAGSQMTWAGGRAGKNKNVTYAGSQMTREGVGRCRKMEKRDPCRLTTDL